jgi:retinol-binding protein 3
MVRSLAIVLLFAGISIDAPVRAQEIGRDEGPDAIVTPELRSKVIEGALRRLKAAYVFPEVAKKMDEAVQARVTRKEYDDVTSAKQLAQMLTDHLQAVSHDKHLRVNYLAGGRPEMMHGKPGAGEREKMREFAATRNFGFEKIERLEGNIGYLDLRGFMSAEMAGETCAAAMNFLANSDALILDLRKNGGGSPAMVALLCSYLFPAEPVVHLNDLYMRPENSTHQWWTLPYVPGKRFVRKPAYVLTSKRTFSAAEECTYNLQKLDRATIVGETTGGGAHPGGPQPIIDKFVIWVPVGRAINPVSKTNWEGTGVKPDIEVPAELALKTAQIEALKKLQEKKKDDPDAVKQLGRALQNATSDLRELKAKGAAADSTH